MRRFYTYIMMSGAILALFPSLQFVLAIASGGLLFPILFLPTAAYYGLALLPFFYRTQSRQIFVLQWIMAAAIGLVALFWPNHRFDDELGKARAQALEIRTSIKKDTFDVVMEAPIPDTSTIRCHEFCQFFLANKNIASLKLTKVSHKSIQHRTFRLDTQNNCLSLASQKSLAEKQIERILENGRCIVGSAANDDKGDVKFVFEGPATNTPPVYDNEMSVYTTLDGRWELRSKRVEGNIEEPVFPPWIGFDMAGGSPSSGSKFVASKTPRNRLLLETIVDGPEALVGSANSGFKPRPVSIEKLREMLSAQLLTMPQSHKLTEETHGVYLQFLEALDIRAPATSVDLTFLAQLLSENRIELGESLRTIMSNVPDIRNAGAELLVRNFQLSCSPSVVGLLTRVSIQKIEQYRERILALANSPLTCHQDGVFLLSGRLGLDPTMKIIEKLNLNSPLVLRAMCISDPKWYRSLKPVLLPLLPEKCDNSGKHNPSLKRILNTLKILGADIEISAWLISCDMQIRRQFESQLNNPYCD
jgi:hypothetical protein